jgi:hypothetical protein
LAFCNSLGGAAYSDKLLFLLEGIFAARDHTSTSPLCIRIRRPGNLFQLWHVIDLLLSPISISTLFIRDKYSPPNTLLNTGNDPTAVTIDEGASRSATEGLAGRKRAARKLCTKREGEFGGGKAMKILLREERADDGPGRHTPPLCETVAAAASSDGIHGRAIFVRRVVEVERR